MNISEALRRIKVLKGELAKLTVRCQQSVQHVKDKPTAFGFKESLNKLAEVRKELVQLEAKVAQANATTFIAVDDFANQLSLAAAIRWLQEYKAHLAFVRSLVVRIQAEETDISYDYDYEMETSKRSRIKVETVHVCHMTESEREKLVEETEARFQKLNAALESANHQTLV